jgi:hypothetical protein
MCRKREGQVNVIIIIIMIIMGYLTLRLLAQVVQCSDVGGSGNEL